MKKTWIFLLLVIAPLWSLATHNRAGEITYKLINNLTYEITVTTFTKKSGISANADRCELGINFGDGTNDSIVRVNGNQGTCGPGIGMGVLVSTDIQKNIYTTTHTYPGPGIYIISVEDPNRNAGILNIGSSDQVRFYVQTELRISAFLGDNCSPTLQNDPIDQGCKGIPYYHNPGAVDTEGDSLVYTIVPCRGATGAPINDYQFPDNVSPSPANTLTIDANTGTVTWDVPNLLGEFNLCIKITEYRNGQEIGHVIRDMQITIVECDHDPPTIDPVGPLCVVAGDFINEDIVATDPDSGRVFLSATGEPLDLTVSPAVFNDDPVVPNGTPSVTEPFEWQTDCAHVRKAPYLVTFKAVDNNPGIELSFFRTLSIQVVAPAPQNPAVNPSGNSLILNWDASSCPQAEGYKIYRRNGAYGFVPGDCEVGVPAYTGYQEIATVTGLNTTTYVDDDNGLGLNHGVQYCYMVVAYFPDGAVSFASVEFCGELIKDLPVITRVSVNATDNNTGEDSIFWSPPTLLDQVQWPGPYQYDVYRADGFGQVSPATLVGSVGPFNNVLQGDTFLRDLNLDTEGQAYAYRVELTSNGQLVGSSRTASSVFLTTTPGDESVTLTWEAEVPWTNVNYEVYTYDLANQTIISLLETVDTAYYQDTGLSNNTEYCYVIRAIGEYSGADINYDLLSFSQVSCAIPVDNEPPCVPQSPFIETSCTLDENRLTWTVPVAVCPESDDVMGYNVYYAPVLGQPLDILFTLNDAGQSETVIDNLTSLAGCFAISAFDSSGNESAFSQVVCTDNCPIYELPNVFTPGSDGFNDLFIPFPYKYVESIDLKIYNRWGTLVHENTNPDINWDGTETETGELVPSGVYYYTCEVNEIRLTGIETRLIKGYVQIFAEGASGGN